MGLFADDKSDNEDWLQQHAKEFGGSYDVPESQAWEHPERKQHDWWKQESRRQSRASVRPLFIGSTKQKCPSCGLEAAVELFRDAKCLACQAADYLGPIS